MKSYTHLFLFLSLLFSSQLLSSQTIKKYSDSEIADLVTDLNSGTYDIYELTTSGGDYTIVSTVNFPIQPTKSFTLRAAEGLAKKPKVSINRASSSTTIYPFYSKSAITATFEGIEFDGENKSETGAAPYFCRFTGGAEAVKVIVRNCYFHSFTHATALFRFDGTAGVSENNTETNISVDIRESIFKNNDTRIIHFETGFTNYGDIYLENNVFSDNPKAVTGTLINASKNGSFIKNITINHCTVNNFNESIGLFALKNINNNISITNSIFTNVGGGFDFSNPIPVIDYCYLEGFATTPTGNITNSFTGVVPEYKNADKLNYELNNKASFICADLLPAGNTMYDDNPTGIDNSIIDNDLYFQLKGNSLLVFEAGLVEIFNMEGKRVYSDKNITNVALNFEKGVYILKFTAFNGQQIIQKILI